MGNIIRVAGSLAYPQRLTSGLGQRHVPIWPRPQRIKRPARDGLLFYPLG